MAKQQTIFDYDFDALDKKVSQILVENLSKEGWSWLSGEAEEARKGNVTRLNVAFAAMPRKTGKDQLRVSDTAKAEIRKIRKGFEIDGWTADRLARVWLLMQFDAKNRTKYVSAIEELFLSAEMNELVALYSALPVLAFPDAWPGRCAEGIRSNIGQVLEAIICNNPYPSEKLDENAWNQLVLKAIFTEKPMLSIVGLKDRMNKSLARSLTDYAHERWAAHRDVNPLLWACMGSFIDSGNFSDIEKIFDSSKPTEHLAAALVCWESNYPPANKLLNKDPEIEAKIKKGEISWRDVAHQEIDS